MSKPNVFVFFYCPADCYKVPSVQTFGSFCNSAHSSVTLVNTDEISRGKSVAIFSISKDLKLHLSNFGGSQMVT